MTPFQILNRFSFLILPLLLLAVVAGLLAWRRVTWIWWAGWIGLVALFLVIVLTSGQRNTTSYDTPEHIRAALAGAGQPTLVEFFSNY